MTNITVLCDDNSMELPVDENGCISVETLQVYYPEATGLFFEDNGKKVGLLTQNGLIKVNRNIDTYTVYLKDQTPTENLSKIDKEKKERISFYKRVIEGSETIEGKAKSIDRKCISDIRNQPSLPVKQKTLYLGWKHRSSDKKKYILRRIPVGGSKELQLDLAVVYTVENIINLWLSCFNHETAQLLLKNSRIKLGFFSNAEIPSFSAHNGNLCGLWEYYKYYNISTHKMQLYLLSTLNEESLLNEEEDLGRFDSVEVMKSIDTTMEEICSKVPEDDTKDSLEDYAIPKKPKLDSELVISNIHSATITSVMNDDNSIVHRMQVMKNNVHNVDVWYLIISTSKYGSNEVSITERDSVGVYWKVTEDDEMRERLSTIEEFNPIHYGFEISRITINGKIYFQMVVDEKMHKSIVIPDCKNVLDHAIVNDSNVISGFCGGDFGIGVIPKCSDCKPIFSWYKDDILYEEGSMLMWLKKIPVNNTDSVWYCKITCAKGTTSSSKIVIRGSNAGIFKSSINKIQEIERSELSITKILIGAGQQGKVFQGHFKDQVVAIKTIPVFSQQIKDIERELTILRTINHANFITLMGFCKELKKVHLVMEFVDGNNLNEILYDEDLKKDYNFSEDRKLCIAKQICKAVTYLHSQSNPIIHRDLKPENILVTKDGQVKICDLGLSTFKVMLTTLRSTVGSRAVGTQLFMAPEIFLENRSASTSSDVWSLACTLIELFQEEPMWNVRSEAELKHFLETSTLPDLKNIPQKYRSILLQKFIL